MNISFSKVVEEECEECREFSLHSHNEEHIVEGSEDGRPEYPPPPPPPYPAPEELLSIVDSWAEDLLKDSDIKLDSSCDTFNRWKIHATHAKFLDRNTDTTCRKISLTTLFTCLAIWKR